MHPIYAESGGPDVLKTAVGVILPCKICVSILADKVWLVTSLSFEFMSKLNNLTFILNIKRFARISFG